MSITPNLLRNAEEVIHGIQIRDPYRWLEDGGSSLTKQWLGEQALRCERYFGELQTMSALRSRVRKYLDVDIVDQAARVGSRYFYRRRAAGQEQAGIYMEDMLVGRERLLIDPSDEGIFSSVGIHRISDDGLWLAIETKRGGSDATEIRFLEVDTGLHSSLQLDFGYPRGLVFASDGFYYCHESPLDRAEHTVRFHSLHSPGTARVVFSRPREPGSQLTLTADEMHLGALWIHGKRSDRVADFFIARRKGDTHWQPVFESRSQFLRLMLSSGRIFAISLEKAPNGRLVELTLDGKEVRTVIREGDAALGQIVAAGGCFFLNRFENGSYSIRNISLDGNDRKIDSPDGGTIHLLPAFHRGPNSIFYTYESLYSPPCLYEYSAKEDCSVKRHEHSSPHLSNACVAYECSFMSKDGIQVPLTLVRKCAPHPGRTQPAIMTAYGGFGISMTPQFSVLVTILLELGVTFALPHVRGGGEFGRAWHDAGRGRNRQKAIDDFVAAAKWICTEEISSPGKLAIFGGSNAGLLMGAAMTQRPGLFRAVLCIAPLLDMVRYEQFDRATKWQGEYGSTEVAEEFRALYGYSPYHHIRRNVNYPSVLFVSGDKDDRCNPAHVRKMVARLQERNAQTNPVLVDYSPERGHSPVLPLSVRVESLARRLAFLCQELRVDVPREVEECSF